MISQEYIKSKISVLIEDVKSLKVNYSFHELSSTHSLEIIPSEIYYSNEVLKAWELNTILEFIESYPEESLCILTDDSILPIEHVDFSVLGKDFKEVREKYLIDLDLIVEFSDDNFYDTFEEIFITYSPESLERMSYNQKIIDVNTLPSAYNIGQATRGLVTIKGETDNESFDCENIYTLAA